MLSVYCVMESWLWFGEKFVDKILLFVVVIGSERYFVGLKI